MSFKAAHIDTEKAKLEWFGGNQDALNLFFMLVDLMQTWDDLVDKDREVSQSEINNAFLVALVYMPSNPFYQLIREQVTPMWMTAVAAFEVANKFEQDKDEHGLEIAHNLRFAVGHVVVYMVQVCVGYEKSKELLPNIWKTIVNERYDEYRKEHLNVNS
jgi:hypothetical protein